MKKELKMFLLYVSVFLAAYFVPFDNPKIESAVLEGFKMLNEYAREHVLFCLVPAFFIAGAISIFISRESVLKYFGSSTPKWISYSIASISGSILAVCSCTVLPLFAGLYTRGAGIGPATAFLYSGPAINVLAIILTARVLGWELGTARAVGAVLFSIIIGLIMSFLFERKDEKNGADFISVSDENKEKRSAAQEALFFLNLVLILIFAAWAKPRYETGVWLSIYKIHWHLTAVLLITMFIQLKRWFTKDEALNWVEASWDFAKQILPLLMGGVLAAGFLMGRPETNAGIIPAEWIYKAVGGNSLTANFIASLTGALMYFATLTEIPILQGLLGAGMGKGPALALLLAGPALSLPNMLVIRRIMGTRKTLAFVGLVVIMATITGYIFGKIS